MPKAIAAERQADRVKCSNGSNSKRLRIAEPAIQNGMTRPSNAARDERTNTCVSSGCRFRTGWLNNATFSSLPHIRPSTSSATKCSIIGEHLHSFGCRTTVIRRRLQKKCINSRARAVRVGSASFLGLRQAGWRRSRPRSGWPGAGQVCDETNFE
jgi:hypothetical protein